MADRIVVDIDGVDHGLELDSVTAAEWRQVHRYSGLTPYRFLAAMASPADAIPEVIESLRWMMLTRAGRTLELGSEESADFPLFEFLASLRQQDETVTPAPKAPGRRKG